MVALKIEITGKRLCTNWTLERLFSLVILNLSLKRFLAEKRLLTAKLLSALSCISTWALSIDSYRVRVHHCIPFPETERKLLVKILGHFFNKSIINSLVFHKQ
jgi:hypothetical protein